MILRARRRSELQTDAKGKQGLKSDRPERIIPERMQQKQRDRDHAGARLTSDDLEFAEEGAARSEKEPGQKRQ